MKWIVRIGIVVVGIPSLAIGLLVAARFRPEHGHILVQTEIDRPASQVFPWISRPEQLQKWVAGLNGMTLISPASDGGEVGKRFRLADVDETDNVTTEMELTITEFTPNERLGIEIDSVSDPVNGFSEAVEYRLTSEGGRTRITFDAHTTYRGKLPRALEPLITPAVRRKAQQDLARLRMMVEAEPAAMRRDALYARRSMMPAAPIPPPTHIVTNP